MELIPAIEAAFLSRGYAVADAAAVFTARDWWELKSARVKWAGYRREQQGLSIPDDLASVVRCVQQGLWPALTGLDARTGGREEGS